MESLEVEASDVAGEAGAGIATGGEDDDPKV